MTFISLYCHLIHDNLLFSLVIIKFVYSFSPLTGNPLAQEILSLYQEPDGTRRLLNYLLDNLAGAIKRSESPPFLHL